MLDAADLWGLTPRRVSELCKQGKIEKARKTGKSWMIPADTPKPADQRFRSGVYAKSALPENLPLPIGISDYRLASTEYYYVEDRKRCNFGTASQTGSGSVAANRRKTV